MSRRYPFLTVCMTALAAVMLLSSCGEVSRAELRASKADSLIFAAGTVMDYERMRTLVDSLETAGDISQLNANRWRGVSYYHQRQYRMAEVCYRKAIECKIQNDQDQLSYNKAARRLSEILLVKGDYEGALKIAVPAIEKMDKSGVGSDIDYAILQNNIGCCQLNLGREVEAKKSFMEAREHYANRWQSDSTSRGYQEAVVGTIYTSLAYINTRRYAESIYWIDRTEMLLNKYRQMPDARTDYFDIGQGRIDIMRAVALQELGKTEEAQDAYKLFLKTDYSKTEAGRINANDYLVRAKRFSEAADNYQCLYKVLNARDTMPSLDNIQLYLLPKYYANRSAGRMDSARVVGDSIFSMLDRAIVNQKNSSMAELATIYNANEQEAQIAHQQAEMQRLRYIAISVALALIVFFLLVYAVNKRKAQKNLSYAHARLEEAHAKLKVAYDQLEATTKAKERYESELRIARDIQRSMLPEVFPHRNDFDVYGAMIPAREVGGDLYDFVMLDEEMYFCVGDVSGKGVPASLFMAQTSRLFRTLAKQHFKPEQIATYMNNALTENNEQGMFVTMFIGFISLKTGALDYCNAGHNPPVLGVDGHDRFMNMESNVPIGLWQGYEFVGEHIDHVRGKLLLVYTDGLNEAENSQQEQFGDNHLLDILNHQHFDTARDLIEGLKEAVEKHRDGAEPNDDLTMLCIFT